MYNKECGILYAIKSKEELKADLQLLEMQKLEIEHHIEYVKSMLNKFRCVEFQKCFESDTKVVLSNEDLNLSLNNIEYFTICAKIREMGANKTLTVHRLVALAFIPNPENKPQVNHINGIKTDNRVENLEWVTATENLNHAFKMGLLADKNAFEYPNTTLTRDQVLEIRELFKTKTNKEIAHKYNVSKEIISKLKNGRTYKNIG